MPLDECGRLTVWFSSKRLCVAEDLFVRTRVLSPWAKTVPRRFCWRATQCLCFLHQMAKRPPKLNQRKRAGKAQSNWSQPYRKSAAERGYGNEWRKLRDRILGRDKRLCQPCLRQGRTTLATEVDHKIPKAEGGTDDEGNLEAICNQDPFLCHSKKTAQEAKRAAKRAASVLIGGVAVKLNK